MSHPAALMTEKNMGVPVADELTSCGAVLSEVQDFKRTNQCAESPSNHRHNLGE